MAANQPSKEHKNDPVGVQRGDYGFNIGSQLLFAAGRLATGPLQYYIVTSLPFSRFGMPPPPTGGIINIGGHTIPRLWFYTALMPTILSSRHALWALTMSKERITLPFTFFAILADGIYESIATLVFTCAAKNPFWSERLFYAGMSLYYGAIAVEVIAELQRAAFKAKPENNGKLCTTGFWGVTRHINYTMNVIYGFGYGLATGGWFFSLPTGGMYVANFTTNAIPSIEDYCSRKYGELWQRYEREVPWKLMPFIY